MNKPPKHFIELCANCGLTLGSHHGGSSPYPYNYCPGHEGRMDWDKGPKTIFEPTGIFRFIEYGTESITGIMETPGIINGKYYE